jgi:spore germination cell wall hydrolase CwlJ-like protein
MTDGPFSGRPRNWGRNGMTDRSLACAALASAVVLAGVAAAEAGPKHRFALKASQQRSDRECLARAMYFESDRTAEDGMLAVGTVVMNRLWSGRYGATVCRVVGQKSQFAPGVLQRAMMEGEVADRARRVADAVLRGERHPSAEGVTYFHTADVPFRKTDKRYVLVSGGNAFYEFRKPDSDADIRANTLSFARAVASAEEAEAEAEPIVTAALAPERAKAPEPAPIDLAALPPPPDGAAQALAYGAAEAPAPGSALAMIAALKPKAVRQAQAAGAQAPEPGAQTARPGPRVIAPGAPVLAASVPTMQDTPAAAAAAAAPARAEPTTANPKANLLVAEAWGEFGGVGR